MRSLARPFMVLGAMVLFHAPAFAQVDMGQNIQNVPQNLNLEQLQDVDLTRGYHLLTIQVPLHARDLHQDVENIEVVCAAYKSDFEYVAAGRARVPYRGRTLDTTVSVPLEFPEGEEGHLTEVAGYHCYPWFLTRDARDIPLSEHLDQRFLLDEASTTPPFVEGSLGQVEIPLPF